MSLNKRTLASYSSISLPMAAMGMPIAVYLGPFYSEAMGLELAVIGGAVLIARLFDVVTDPIMGWAVDRFDTRWGRRKPWIAGALPLLLGAVFMVFLPPFEQVSAAYITTWLVVLYAAFTMMQISHQSWGADLVTTYDERSRLFGWREYFVLAGMVTVLGLPALLEQSGTIGQTEKFASMGYFVLIFFPITTFLVLRNVPDSHRPSPEKVNWAEALKIMVTNSKLWRLLVADLFSAFGTQISGALYLFLASYAFGLPEWASLCLLFYFVSGFVFMPAWLAIAYRIGKHTTFVVAQLYAAVINIVLIFFIEPGNLTLLWVFTILYGAAFGASPTLLRSMMADLTDDDELRSGRRRAGMFFALLTLTNKFGAAGGASLGLIIAGRMFGFQPGTENSAESIEGLMLTFCIGTAVGMTVSVVTMFTYPLTRERHAEIREQLEARASAQS